MVTMACRVCLEAVGIELLPQDGAAPNAQTPGVNPNDGNVQPQTVRAPQALAACENLSQGDACSFTLRDGNTINGLCITPPGTDQLACAPQGRLPQNGQAPLSRAIALNRLPACWVMVPMPAPTARTTATAARPSAVKPALRVSRASLYAPLSKQMSWLLPFALVGMVLAVFAARVRLPLEPEHKALVLWGGWLLTCLVFFSAVEGIFHAYYAIMLAPALGAVVGGGFGQLWRWQAHRRWIDALLIAAAAVTIAFQVYTAFQYGATSLWVYIPVILLMAAIGLLLVPALRRVGYVTVLAAMLTIPLIWTALTVFDATPEVNLPTAFDASQQTRLQPAPELNERNKADEELVAYLQANTQDAEYMLAVPSSQVGSPLVLATGRPVLYMGGFNGGDPVIDAAGLAELVANGELRYVLYGAGRNNEQDISNWLVSSCTAVPEFSQGNDRPAQGQQRPGNNQPTVLYQCG